MYYTYIIYSAKLNRYYVGSTQDLTVRIGRHNRGDGCKYTKKGAPWKLSYVEEFTSRQEAVVREMAIKKKKSRKYIEYLISTSG